MNKKLLKMFLYAMYLITLAITTLIIMNLLKPLNLNDTIGIIAIDMIIALIGIVFIFDENDFNKS